MALTYRENQVLKLLSQGLTAKEIGEHLKLSFRTVEGYIATLLYLFEAKNTAHMMVIAMREGFIS